jgi:hypothetical protein
MYTGSGKWLRWPIFHCNHPDACLDASFEAPHALVPEPVDTMSTTQQPSLTETTKNLVKPDSLTVQQLPTPCPSSGSVTPEPGEQPDETMPIKRKKKKKSKKNAKAKTTTAEQLVQNTAQPALRISRNKHWRYISSYHVRVMKSMV